MDELTDTSDGVQVEEDINDYVEISKDGMKNGLIFQNEKVALNSIEKWCELSFCPLTRARSRKKATLGDSGKIKYARIDFQCPHGIKYKSKAEKKRPFQKIYHTGCKVKLSLAEQEDGSWITVNCQVENHDGHPISEEAFLTYRRSRQINDKDMKLIEDLIEGQAQPKNISDILNGRKDMGNTYDAQLIRNVRTKLKDKKDVATVEEALDDIIRDGGTVKYKKKEGSNDVKVLTVQTNETTKHLAKCKPTLF